MFVEENLSHHNGTVVRNDRSDGNYVDRQVRLRSIVDGNYNEMVDSYDRRDRRQMELQGRVISAASGKFISLFLKVLVMSSRAFYELLLLS